MKTRFFNRILAAALSLQMVLTAIPFINANAETTEAITINSSDYADGTLNCSIYVPVSESLLSAIYSTDGTLIKITEDKNVSGDIVKTFEEVPESGRVKFMLWNSLKDMEPLSMFTETSWDGSDYDDVQFSTLSLWYDEPAAADDSECWDPFDSYEAKDRWKETHLVWKQKSLPIGNGFRNVSCIRMTITAM